MRVTQSTAVQRQFYTAEEVAQIFGLPAKTIYDFALKGRLPHHKLGRHVPGSLQNFTVCVCWN